MTCKVRLKGSDVDFFAEQGESLLDAAIRVGLSVDYGCNNGNCGLCGASLIEGEVRKIRHQDYPQSAAGKQKSFLMCCHEALSDLVIEVCLDGRSEPIREQGFSARVRKLDRVGDRVRVVSLRLPRNLRLRFLAGQYAVLSGKRFDLEQCSIASCPCEQQRIELHVPRRRDAFARYIFESCRVGDRINVTAPFGNFVFTEDFDRPVLFFAFEVGFAPIKSLIEHITGQEHEINLRLYWMTVGDRPYLHNLCRSWADAFDGFSYSHLVVKDGSAAALGSCIQDTLAGQPGLSASDAYFCVPQASGDTVTEVCLGHGFDSSRLFYEPVRGGVV